MNLENTTLKPAKLIGSTNFRTASITLISHSPCEIIYHRNEWICYMIISDKTYKFTRNTNIETYEKIENENFVVLCLLFLSNKYKIKTREKFTRLFF